MDRVLDSLVKFLSSLKLTVVCLALGMVLVFWGTLAQVELGLYKAQNDFFRSFFVYWGPKAVSWKLPVFPGGYLLGGVLLLNLIAAHFSRFKFTRKKLGIWMVHFGVILLLLGQLLTDALSRESMLHLREGEAKNYSESDRQVELAVVDTTDADSDKVVAIPQAVLMTHKAIQHPDLPFTIQVKKFYANSELETRAPDSKSPPAADQDLGSQVFAHELPRVTEMNSRDVPSAVVELDSPQGSLGTWLVSEYLSDPRFHPQKFKYNNRTYELTMRLRRFYKPFTVQLLQFRHDIYPGTDIPKNYSSRVLLQRPETGENREVLIYMNNPLRYAGETFYQSSFDQDDHGSVLQVVHNPSWLTPYFSCILVGIGLLVQFSSHLFGFAWSMKKKAI